MKPKPKTVDTEGGGQGRPAKPAKAKDKWSPGVTCWGYGVPGLIEAAFSGYKPKMRCRRVSLQKDDVIPFCF